MVLTDEWLDGAREDLNSELDYIYEEFGTKSAEKAYLKVVDVVDTLRHYPEIGRVFENMDYHGINVRSISMRQTSIIYCVLEDKLLIIALWNNRQDVRRLPDIIGSR